MRSPDQSVRAGLAKVSSNRTGVIGGADYGFGSARVGINGGYVDADVTLEFRAPVARLLND